MSAYQARTTTRAPDEGRSEVRFSQGMALFYLAEKYDLLEDVVCEAIQNALDANATWIKIQYNLSRLMLQQFDNGDGASVGKFDAALQQICSTQKTEDKLGRFGIGVISPLGKCAQFTFTSCAKDGPDGYNMWTFDSNEIKAQEEEVTVPRERLNAAFSREGGNPNQPGRSFFNWRTRVQMFDVTQDKFVSRFSIDSIEQRLYESYNKRMIDLGVVIEFEILDGKGKNKRVLEQREVRGRKFRGKKLSSYTYKDPDTGATTIFDLGVAPLAGKTREGKIKLGEMKNAFRLGIGTLMHFGVGKMIRPEAIEALMSGNFEGEIIDSAISLHVSRKSFVKNDALVGLGIAIEAWYEAAGKKLMEGFNEESRDERYQRIGESSARVFDAMLRDPRFASLRDMFKTNVSTGTVGRGHAEIDGRNVLGKHPHKSVVAHGSTPGNTREGRGDNDHSGGNPTHDAPGHTPTVVRGPRGQRRIKVRGDSQGPQIVYDFEGSISPKLWDFEFHDGALVLNTLHPLWAGLEGKNGEARLGRFQEKIFSFVLEYAKAPETWRPMLRSFSEDLFKHEAFLALHADKIAGRGPGRQAKVKK